MTGRISGDAEPALMQARRDNLARSRNRREARKFSRRHLIQAGRRHVQPRRVDPCVGQRPVHEPAGFIITV